MQVQTPQTLVKHDLIDELRFKIFPVMLGLGKRLFGDGTIPAAFTGTDFKVSPKNVIIASYKRNGRVEVEAVLHPNFKTIPIPRVP